MSASRAKFINDYLHRFSNKIEINNFSINDYDEMPSDVGINANHEISDDVSTNESNNISDNIIFNKDANQSVIEDKDLIAMSIAKQEEVVDLIITSKVDEKNEENFPINSDKGEDIECDEKIIENKNSDKNEDCAVSNIISDDYSISDLSIDIIQLGKKIKNDLYHKYGDDLYNAWFSNLYLIKINNNNTAVFSILTLFIKEWIISHYVDDLESIIKVHIDYISGVEIVVNADLVVENNENCNLSGQSIETHNDCDSLDPRFTFDNFVVGKSNELAFAAARRVAESTVPVIGSNPLFLYGGVGLGKTHLMHAIAWHIKTKFPNRRVIYLSAEKFMYQYIMALRNKDIMLFKERYRSVDVLMVDDVQFISGKDSTQEEFFHTFNALIDQSKQLVISADRSPSSLNGVEERIKSRLGWGLVADINDTTFELRMGILQSKVSSLGIDIPPKVLEFLAQQIESNVRELEGALNKVIAHSSLLGSGITIEGTEEILADLLHSSKRKIVGINEIQRIVANHYKIKVSCLTSSSRSREFSRPRQIAMYLAKTMTKESLPSIGRNFGGRDHATVIHAVKKIEKMMSSDSDIEDGVKTLTKLIMTSE